jgi:hypothetical protein
VTPAAGTLEFAIRCTNAVAERRAEVTVLVHGPPDIDISVSPAELASGSLATLEWSTYDATSCEASNAWSGTRATTGALAVSAGTPGIPQVYELTCIGPGGTSTASAVLTVLFPPEVTFTATPPTITQGNSTTLEWSTVGADTCFAGGDWLGARSVSGNLGLTLNEGGWHTFSLTCFGPGGFDQASVTVQVIPLPSITFTVDPDSMFQGNLATLTWSTTDATACVASGEWSGDKAPAGTTVVSPGAAGTHTYILTCSGAGGETVAMVTLTVTAGPMLAFNLSPVAILEGQSATLTWAATGATSCTASDTWNGARNLGGTLVVTPAAGTWVYTLTCTNANDNVVNSSVTLYVLALPDPPQRGGNGGGGPVPAQALLVLLAMGFLRMGRRPTRGN